MCSQLQEQQEELLQRKTAVRMTKTGLHMTKHAQQTRACHLLYSILVLTAFWFLGTMPLVRVRKSEILQTRPLALHNRRMYQRRRLLHVTVMRRTLPH
jgi:hypothetical protein